MIIQKIIENNRIHTYSDSGYQILQKETGILYYDAIDINPNPYTYQETNELIPESVTNSEEILNILLGGE